MPVKPLVPFAPGEYLSGMPKELKDVRVPVMLTKSELSQVDEWRYESRIPTRAEAIRRLIGLGLEAAKTDKAAKRNPRSGS